MTEEKKAVKETKKQYKKIAIIRIRGSVKVKEEIKDTMKMLQLYKQNNCILLEDTPSIHGMLKKVESYITWGEVDEETIKLLKKERQEKEKAVFRLHPPRKGFERKGIKIPFKLGGALGYRGEKINDLIKKMI